MPAEAKLELALTGNGGDEAMLEKAEQRVPKRVALGPPTAGDVSPILVRASRARRRA